ncbi:hypothetical protein KY290_011840 [Solanum tuberosum]|uniref:Uncharacterized protein n=1 Tax=Solanum tuberosum TaxID=4113 RepID=A0ABQ7W3T5_SOLTU|nr:hypothetical protein KY290_011840 [Solanum tuberosum]
MRDIIKNTALWHGFVDIARGVPASCKCTCNIERRPFPCSERMELPGIFRGPEKFIQGPATWSYLCNSISESSSHTPQYTLYCCKVCIWMMILG